MDKLNDLIKNAMDTFKGENGPTYAGIIGIVLIVLGRYGYKLRSLNGSKEITFAPCLTNDFPVVGDYIESPDDSVEDSSDE